MSALEVESVGGLFVGFIAVSQYDDAVSAATVQRWAREIDNYGEPCRLDALVIDFNYRCPELHERNSDPVAVYGEWRQTIARQTGTVFLCRTGGTSEWVLQGDVVCDDLTNVCEHISEIVTCVEPRYVCRVLQTGAESVLEVEVPHLTSSSFCQIFGDRLYQALGAIDTGALLVIDLTRVKHFGDLALGKLFQAAKNHPEKRPLLALRGAPSKLREQVKVMKLTTVFLVEPE